MTTKHRLNWDEDAIYRRVMARISELMESDPELGSRDGIELDHLTAAIELYERLKWSAVEPEARHSPDCRLLNTTEGACDCANAPEVKPVSDSPCPQCAWLDRHAENCALRTASCDCDFFVKGGELSPAIRAAIKPKAGTP